VSASSGGPTSPANVAIACRRHHRLKHQTPWSYQANDDGTHTWTSPTGHHYQNQPPDRWGEPQPPTNTRPNPPTKQTEPTPPTTNTQPDPPTTQTEQQAPRTAKLTDAHLNIQHYGTSVDATRDFRNGMSKTRTQGTPAERHNPPGIGDPLSDDPPF
jgi:hypothetical protein